MVVVEIKEVMRKQISKSITVFHRFCTEKLKMKKESFLFLTFDLQHGRIMANPFGHFVGTRLLLASRDRFSCSMGVIPGTDHTYELIGKGVSSDRG